MKLGRVGALVIYILFTLLFFETVFRVAYSFEPFMLRTLADESVSWRRLWVWGHKKTGEELLYPTEIYDPALGWRTAPNLNNSLLRGKFYVSTNSYGFRALEEISSTKLRPRILLLGDSYTFGDEANDREVFAYILQQLLPGAEVINMGVRGYGHDQMLLLFQEEGVRLLPDIVIIGFVTMDMERNLLDFRDYSKPMFVLSENNLLLTNHPVPPPEDVLSKDWMRPRLYDLWAYFEDVMVRRSGEKKEAAEQVTWAILSALEKSILESGAVPLLVYYPSDYDIRELPPTTEGEAYLAEYCEANSATICSSAWDEFREKIISGAHFRQVGHWDALGHKTTAQALYNLILEAGLLP